MVAIQEQRNSQATLQLAIEQMACRFNLPAGLESPGRVRDRITRIAQHDIPKLCGAALSSLPGDDEAVYRIRHLHLELWVDLQGMSDVDIAQRWSNLLTKAVMQAMYRGSSQQIRRFDSPRQFVAAFLRDLIDGRAWNCWYYDEFRLLQPLPDRTVAAQLLVPRPSWIFPILTDLAATGHTARLIERWGQVEIEQLWEALDFSPQPAATVLSSNISPVLHILAALWPSIPRSGRPSLADRGRDRLRLWLAAVTAQPDWDRAAVPASLIHLLVEVAALLRLYPDFAPLLLMESGLYPAVIQQIATGSMADALGWLIPLSNTADGQACLRQLAEIVGSSEPFQPSQTPHSPDADPPDTTPAFKDTSERASPTSHDSTSLSAQSSLQQRQPLSAQSSAVGSVFLLLPAFVESGLWQHWREEQGEDRARHYLFVLALKALGRERTPLLLGDPMLACFAGLSAPPLADARLPLEADGHREIWMDRLPEIAARWYPAHQRDLAIASTPTLQLLRDAVAAHWLAAQPLSQEETEEDLARRWANLAPEGNSIRRDLTAAERDAIATETAHLQLGQTLGYPWLTPTLDAALSAATSFILRRTAARLPGFTQSSPAYLANQFLAQPATLQPTPTASIVRLSGGPLALVLRMAAFPERLEVPWLSAPVQLNIQS